MALLKPALDGIGSASGVAWPIFGIVSSALSFSTSSTASFILGSLCSTLFLLVSLPIIYFSFQKAKQQQLTLNKKQENFETILLSNLVELFATVKQSETLSLESNFSKFLKKKRQELQQSSTEEKKLFDKFIKLLIILNSPSIYNSFNHSNPQTFNSFLNVSTNQFLIDELNKKRHFATGKDKMYASFLGFVGAFGTIAGGSAGISGLLTGLGLITGFSAAPWAGFIIIITATIVATYIALNTAKITELNAAKTYQYKRAKRLGIFLQEIKGEIKEIPGKIQAQTLENEKSQISELFNKSDERIQEMQLHIKTKASEESTSSKENTSKLSSSSLKKSTLYPKMLFNHQKNTTQKRTLKISKIFEPSFP